MSIETGFAVVLRGYDRAEVDAVVQRVNQVLASDDAADRTALGEELRRCEFSVRLRGYDRSQVDAYLSRAASAISGL